MDNNSKKTKKNFTLDEKSVQILVNEREETGASESEIIRRALKYYGNRNKENTNIKKL